MNILAKFKGKTLIERYGRSYVRFMGGREEDMPCEFPIAEEDRERAIACPEYLNELLNNKRRTVLWEAETFYELGTVEYLVYGAGETPERARAIYTKLSAHRDILKAFYGIILESNFKRKPVCIEGYTAERLMNEYALPLHIAYGWLVSLRETPEKALAELEAMKPANESANQQQNKPEEVQPMEEEKIAVEETVEEAAPAEASEDGQNQPEQPKEASNADSGELIAKLDGLQQAIDGLKQCFEDKIAEDEHKNRLFDNMHRELTRYQNGAVDKIIDTMAMDIIQLVDAVKGHARVYEEKEPTEENYKKLLRVVKGMAEDLQDVLYRQSIEPYNVDGDNVDVRRQKIIQTIPTDDQTKDNLIAARAADGYEKDGKVLRPERIKIYKYVPAKKEETNN